MSDPQNNTIQSLPPPSNIIVTTPQVSNVVESQPQVTKVLTSNVGPKGDDGPPGAGSLVSSVFGRIGDIVGQDDDYNLGQIDGLRNDGVGQSFLADNGLYLQITAGVSSFAGRTGDVTTEAGDYSAFYDAIGSSAVVQGNLSAHSADQTNPHVVTGTQVGLGNVDNTADADKPVSVAAQAALDLKEDLANKGLADGYTPLDAQGKVSGDFLNITGLVIIGPWSAAANDPLLANGTGDLNDTYWATDAGTVDFGAGPITFAIGDYAVYTNTNVWDRIPAAAPVTQVFGRIGNITSVAGDYDITQIGSIAIAGIVSGEVMTWDGSQFTPKLISPAIVYNRVATGQALGVGEWSCNTDNSQDATSIIVERTSANTIDNRIVWENMKSGDLIGFTDTGVTGVRYTLTSEFSVSGGEYSASVTGTGGNVAIGTINNAMSVAWASGDSSPVASVFGRLGAVIAASDDYALDQITGLTSLGGGTNYLANDGTYRVPDGSQIFIRGADNTNPGTGEWSVDDALPNLATQLQVHRFSANGGDLQMVLEQLRVGDGISLSANGVQVRYTLSSVFSVSGSVYSASVTPAGGNPVLGDRTTFNASWPADSSGPAVAAHAILTDGIHGLTDTGNGQSYLADDGTYSVPDIPGGGAGVYNDQFSAAAGPLGSPWVNLGSGMEYDGNGFAISGGAGGAGWAFYSAVVETGLSDVDITAYFIGTHPTGTSLTQGILFRNQSADSVNAGMTFGLRANDNTLDLMDNDSGAVIANTPNSIDFSNGAMLRVVCVGSNIKCFANDALVFDVSYAPHQNNTRHGMRMRNNTTHLPVDWINIANASYRGGIITEWQDFALVWKVSSGGQPSIGNGTLIGKYRRVGDTCEIRIGMLWGATTDNGSGDWLWELPPGLVIDMAKMWRVQYARVGNASTYDISTRERSGRPYQRITGSEFGVASDFGNWSANTIGSWAEVNIDCSWPIVGW